MAKQRFKITKFTNPSGDVAWRVSGTLNGQRVRKNFKTRDEAVAERQQLNIRFLNEKDEGQTVWTTLTHEENRDAIAAVNLLKKAKSNKPLSFVVDYFIKHYKEAAKDVLVDEAIEHYLEEKSKDEVRKLISFQQMQCIRAEMNKFKEHLGSRLLSGIQVPDIEVYLEKVRSPKTTVVSLKTWNNRRGYLSTFFKYCLAQKYIGENPILEIPQHKIKHRRGSAEIMSVQQAEDLMRYLESYRGKQVRGDCWWGCAGCMVPYFALALFAGIRPDCRHGEMGRLQPKHVRMDTGVILIEPEVSKVNEKRSIQIQGNLEAWLTQYPHKKYPILPQSRFMEMRAHVREEFNLGHDVLRHTYISMLVGKYRSVGDAALQAGNSEAVIRKHYLDLVSQEEAEKFWNIVPSL